jgi:type II secretory pathway component GspD/PulD (secretin)
VVLDGDTTELEVGRQIPVLTQGSNLGGAPGNLEFIGASNLLSVTPHVIDDDNGNPVAVNLQLQLESNEVDTAVVSQGVPSVNRRSIQSRLILNQEKTVILGGFTVDSLSNDVSKTPGLGDLPILGYLFKRKVKRAEINRLYFAISVEIVPYGSVIEPVVVPGATTNIPTVLPEMIKPVKEINNPVISKP